MARRTRIPADLLDQLESGDLAGWPRGLYGRVRLVNYARASGLNPEEVVAAVWPRIASLATGLPTEQADPKLPPEPPRVAAAEPQPTPIQLISLDFAPDDELFASEDRVSPADRRGGRRAARAVTSAATRPRFGRTARLAVGGVAAVAVGVLAAILVHRDTSPWHAPEAQATLERSAPAVDALPPAPAPSRAPAAVKAGPPASSPAPANRAAEPPAPESRIQRGSEREPAPVRSTGRSTPAAIGTSGLRFTAAHPATGLSKGAAVYSPAFAPGGDAIFYHAETADRSRLMRAETDASGSVTRVRTVMDDDARNFHVRPSPDGRRIAFDSDRDGVRAVYVANANGARVEKVSGDGYASVPSWSPDGRRLVFVRAEKGRPRVWNLWELTLKSGALRRLTSHKYGQPWGGSWFPDGRRIAYSHEDRLIVLDLARGTSRVYRSPRSGRLVRTPAVSPDGREILFQVFRDGAWLLDVPSGSMRKVLDDQSAEEYSWSPDGRRVAYHSRRSGRWGVWTMAATE